MTIRDLYREISNSCYDVDGQADNVIEMKAL